MSYVYYQKTHPEWPKKLRDALHRKVEVKRALQTKSGNKFQVGLVMTIESVHRGFVTLRTHGVPYGAPGSWIRRVHLSDVRLLPT